MKLSLKLNAVLNVIKQLLAILFPMITMIIVISTLGKDNYGHVNYVKSIVSYFALFAGLGISTYAVREGAYIRDDKNKYAELASEVFTINVASTIVSYLVLFVCILLFREASWANDMPLVLILSGVIVLTTIGADWINTTFEDYLYITIRYILFYAIAIGLLFVLIRDPNDYLEYALLIVVATAGGNVLNVLYIRRYVKLRLVSFKKCIKHLKAVFVLFSSNVATTIYINSDITMIGAIINDEAVAIYSVASNIYIAVKQIANAAITVAMPKLIRLISDGKKEEYSKTMNGLVSLVSILIFPAMVGLYSLSENLMVFMGGEENGFEDGAVSLKILCFAIFFAVLNFVISRCVTLPFKEDKIYMASTAISALINIVLNFILLPLASYNGAAITTLISEIVVFVILLFNCRKHIIITYDLRNLISVVPGCIYIYFVCELLRGCSLLPNILYICLSILISVGGYFIILLLTKNSTALRYIKQFNSRRNRKQKA